MCITVCTKHAIPWQISSTDLDATFWKPAVCTFQSPGGSCERGSTATYGVTCCALSWNKTSCSILPGSIITNVIAWLPVTISSVPFFFSDGRNSWSSFGGTGQGTGVRPSLQIHPCWLLNRHLRAPSFGYFWPAVDCYLQTFLCCYSSPEPSGPCCRVPADGLINQSNRAVHIKYTAEAAVWCLFWAFYFSRMFQPL